MSVAWLMRMPPTCSPPERHLGVAVERHGAAGVGVAVLAPDGQQDAAHGLAGLERLAAIAFEVDGDRLLVAAGARLDVGHGDGARAGDQVVRVQLVRFRSNELAQVSHAMISSYTLRSVGKARVEPSARPSWKARSASCACASNSCAASSMAA